MRRSDRKVWICFGAIVGVMLIVFTYFIALLCRMGVL